MASPVQALSEHLVALNQAPLQQKLGYLITLAALIAVLAGMWMWSKTPDYRVLFPDLTEKDSAAVASALNQMNVPYRFSEGGGALMVPAQQWHEVRMRLAAQDLPRNAANGGFEGYSKLDNQKFGTSVFVEQINYQRALESELARSIQTIAGVQAARVHLAMNRPSVFVRESQKPSASVVLQLAAGRTLEAPQVTAIVNLVSNSVPDLPARNVSVVDQTGTLLSSQISQPGGLDPTQIKQKRELEQDMIRRVELVVSPIVGEGNVRAQVTADMDFSKIERVDENYAPNGQPENATIRSSNVSESVQTGNGPNGGGVPGAASNQPPQPASAPVTAAPGQQPGQPAQPAAAAAAPVTQQKNATTNYEVNRNVIHSVQQIGTLKRLSLAVVVNHRTVPGQDGQPPTTKPLTDAEKAEITKLIKDAVAFDEKRGDSLSLVNAAFTPPATQPVEEIPLWKNPELLTSVQEIGRNLLIAGIALYLVLGVLRPMLRTFATPPAPEPELLSAPAAEPDPVAEKSATYEANLQTAKTIARQDPKLVANVVRGWVTNDG
jgi:flagellar M-ring protein FliF